MNDHSPPPNAGDLLRRAAEAGPGWRGKRAVLTRDAITALCAELQDAGIAPPAYLGSSTQWVDREAKLFECGDYPDKGVRVEPQHLSHLERTFDLPVPILVEHAESPLQIGFLTDVWVSGHELMGTLALSAEADRLVESSKARSLSLGLAPDLSAIHEVSLVRSPRVADARLFGGSVCFHGALTAAQPAHEVHRQLDRWIQAGRLQPAQIELARALLGCATSIRFRDEDLCVRDLMMAFMERQPTAGLFAAITPDCEPAASAFTPDEAAFYRRHFPDLDLGAIAAAKPQSPHANSE